MGVEPSAGTNGSREAIGVDLGGTKMAVGVVAEGPVVHHRAEARSLGLTAEELLHARIGAPHGSGSAA